MRNRLFLSTILIGLWLLTAHLSGAQTGKKAYGIIDTLDREGGTITLLMGKKLEPKAFSLSRPDLPVTNALSQPLKLADLAKGQRVRLQLGESDDATAIRLDENVEWGTVLELKPDQRKLVVKSGSLQHTLSIPEEALVLLDGEKARLADLKVAQGVKVIFSGDDRRVLQVQAGKGIVSSNPYHGRRHDSGILMKINHEERKLRILTQEGRYKLEDFEFEAWAVLRLIHSSYLLRLSDILHLQPYCKISFYYETDTRKIVQVSALVPVLSRRRVEAVDRAGRRLTIRTENDQAERLSVAVDAMIQTPKGQGKWDDVPEGALVSCGLTLDGKEIVYIHVLEK